MALFRMRFFIQCLDILVLVVSLTLMLLTSAVGSVTGDDPSNVERDEPSPSFVDTRREVKVGRSDMALLPCSVRNLGKRQVVWRRLQGDEFMTIGAMVYTNDHRVVVDYGSDERGAVRSFDLIIKNAQFSDAGIYECQITSIEFLTRNVDLRVFEKPMATVQVKTPRPTTMTTRPSPLPSVAATVQQYLTPKQHLVTAGQPIRLVCNTSLGNASIPRSRLEWYKDGRNIHSNKHRILTRFQFETSRMYVSQLDIDRSRSQDTGEYQCRMEEFNLLTSKILVLPKSKASKEGKARPRKDQAHYYATEVFSPADDKNRRNAASIGCLIDQRLFMSTIILYCSMVLKHILSGEWIWRGSSTRRNNYLSSKT